MQRPSRHILIIAGVLAILAAPTVAQVADEQKQKLEEVQRQIEERRAREKALADETAKLDAKVKGLRAQSVAAARALQKQEAQVTALEDRIAVLQREQQAKEASLQERRAELGTTLGALARLQRQPPETLLLAPGDAVDNIRTSQLVAALVPRIEEKATGLRAELVSLGEVRDELHARQSTLAAEAAKLDRERRALEALTRETRQTWSATRSDRQQEAKQAQLLEEDAKELRALIRRLEEEERRRVARERQLAEERRRQAERDRQSRDQRQAALPPATPSGPSVMLALPAAGRITGRYGEDDRFGQPRKGVELEVRPRAQVVSPADGKVVFADRFRGYGLLLIIAHAGGYHSLLAGFEHIDANVGQAVSAGEPVGRVGNGDGERPVLYVEVRQRGEPVNPVPWLTASARKVSG